MARPGAVIEVDRNTPPTLFHYGEGFRLERLPLGTQIVYPPDPIDPIGHPERAIRRALSTPLEADPLKELLRPGMKLTIAFDDLSLPLPPMAAPDVRGLVIEEVVDAAARAGVEDVELIAAISLHRKMTADEIRHIVGDRVFTTFWPDRLYNHDAEDPNQNVLIGRTNQGEEVWLNRRAFHSMFAPYGMTGVNAGQVDKVHDKTLENVRRQMMVPVEGQTDIVTLGVPYLGPYNVNSIMNPVLVVCTGLGYLFNLYKNKPVVREGGVVIIEHPCRYEFNAVHHPSYVDFYDEVLADTTDPHEIESRYEKRFAEDAWYGQMYQQSHAYHGVHPRYAWYWDAFTLN